MNAVISKIEKHQAFFEKISRNIYLQAVKDGFLAVMPIILFSSVFLLIASLPVVFGVTLPAALTAWLMKIYNYTMGVVGMMVAATTARCLSDSMNRKMPEGRVINGTSVMIAAICGFLLLAISTTKAGNLTVGNMGTTGLLSAFVSAFLTVNVYRFCVARDITIHMPKEVPGAIAQNFRDIFPFSFAVLASAIIDTISRATLQVPFADILIKLFKPLYFGAESYLGITVIWFLIPMFWFVGVHGPSVVKPAIQAVLLTNTAENLKLFMAGGRPVHALTENFSNFVGSMGGTGATFIVPFLLIFFMKSKQLRAIGKTSIIPVMFAVNEPLLFGAPMILNPYMLVPFIMAPLLNVWICKFFVDTLMMNGFIYVMPWATPAPLGIFLDTNFQLLSLLLIVILLVVDAVVYMPFLKAYDKLLISQEATRVASDESSETVSVEESVPSELDTDSEITEEAMREASSGENDPIKVLVLCAGGGTSDQLANALREGAKAASVNIVSAAAAYGNHYSLLPNYDMVILAPQVKPYYEDLKQDTDKLGIKLIPTKGNEYINLTRDPKQAVKFVLDQLKHD
jgi:PTS system lactose-specific IIC component